MGCGRDSQLTTIFRYLTMYAEHLILYIFDILNPHARMNREFFLKNDNRRHELFT